MGVLTSAHGRPGAGGMEWRVTIEPSGADGTKQTHEVARGGGADPHSTLDPLGLRDRPKHGGRTSWSVWGWSIAVKRNRVHGDMLVLFSPHIWDGLSRKSGTSRSRWTEQE